MSFKATKQTGAQSTPLSPVFKNIQSNSNKPQIQVGPNSGQSTKAKSSSQHEKPSQKT